MKRFFFCMSLMLSVSGAKLWAEEPVWFGKEDALRVLYINSAMDLASFEPILTEFVALHPDVRVAYRDVNTLELYYQTIKEQKKPQASLVVSSAMDLHLKLVNDGYAQTYQSSFTDRLPEDFKWRNQLFAFSLEPIVMLVNKKAFPGNLPEDRQSLLQTIRQNEKAVTKRIGTYDIRKSGVGYLLASQDARQADVTWGRLLEAFGSHDVQTYCCTHEIIDDVASGKLVLGYNLLGSYASQRARDDDRLKMILPKDYTLMLMRVALIPKSAPNAEDAGIFLDYLLSDKAQGMMQTQGLLFPIRPDLNNPNDPYVVNAPGPTGVIELDQQLLVGRDYAKQKRFIRNWEMALEISEDD
ncbi:iron ABC transporter substrate-binding protein [Marinomonas primoryensis]|jgi:iron(III) transport system substrate-binding protein|uniref:Iron ABC transporter substrate-binding protein n=1 Tax=Marinomonas primoryensis TaxID=178399 RepID=A0A2Z4PSL4_9GAMM|nr:ABC transporter substrate-binding protein [Marinomonas primoryensis]AWY00473.1 iron ABC transporter substrate-binding protein [Marinomonas primoryensis]|tara:strand:+ start:493 stop:1557 length:1065 start_codon:yes stop_codon:yes gene_type:complete